MSASDPQVIARSEETRQSSPSVTTKLDCFAALAMTEGELDLDTKQLDGACHCGMVRFTVMLTDGSRTARRCTCSYCRMRGAIAVSAALDGVRITHGEEALASYRFNTGAAQHFFCSRCGIYTHHQRRSNPNEYGVNVACLGISPFDFAEVPVMDGENHPSDTGVSRRAGTLRFEPSAG